MTPAPDTGRTAEEMRAQIRKAVVAAMPENIPLRGRMARSIMAAVIEPILKDLIAARKERDEAIKLARMGFHEKHVVLALGQAEAIAARESAEAEAAQLRSRLLQAEKGAEAMRDVQEAVVARWREAAMMAVGGDLRRLQRLLDASQGRIVGSAPAVGDEPRCTATGNPCGTDTVLVGRQCPDNRWGGRCAHRIAEAARAALNPNQEAGDHGPR